MALKTYHHAWLSIHPNRTATWLQEHLADGFEVHHIDGDHSNDDPLNLVLIEGGDHMRLHNRPAIFAEMRVAWAVDRRQRKLDLGERAEQLIEAKTPWRKIERELGICAAYAAQLAKAWRAGQPGLDHAGRPNATAAQANAVTLDTAEDPSR